MALPPGASRAPPARRPRSTGHHLRSYVAGRTTRRPPATTCRCRAYLSSARPPGVSFEGSAARFSAQEVEPLALAPRPLHIGFLVASDTQPRRYRPPVAAQTRAGQLDGMSHSIVTPITHAPSTLDFCQHPRGAYIGRGVGRVKGNRYGSKRSLDAVEIQSQHIHAPV